MTPNNNTKQNKDFMYVVHPLKASSPYLLLVPLVDHRLYVDRRAFHKFLKVGVSPTSNRLKCTYLLNLQSYKNQIRLGQIL